jgi:hypothetical protein
MLMEPPSQKVRHVLHVVLSTNGMESVEQLHQRQLESLASWPIEEAVGLVIAGKNLLFRIPRELAVDYVCRSVLRPGRQVRRAEPERPTA